MSNVYFNVYSKDEIPFFDMLKKTNDKITVDDIDYDVYIGTTDDLDDLVYTFMELQYMGFDYDEYLDDKYKYIYLDDCNMNKREIFRRIQAIKNLMTNIGKTSDETFEIVDEFLRLTTPNLYENKHKELEKLKVIYNEYENLKKENINI